VNAVTKRVLKLTGLALMYSLASPVLVIQWVRNVRKQVAAIERIRAGVLECPYCRCQNPLNRMATCARCRASEPSSVLRCSFCKATFKTITCDQCTATLRVV
jgi:aspartate carbamoyltransferase regulatory subunit